MRKHCFSSLATRLGPQAFPWAFSLLLASCATPSLPPSDAPPAADGPVAVSMHVEALSQSEQRQHLLRASESLRSGDGVALYFKVDRPAYVYVAMIPPGGAPNVLYPTEGERLQQPGTEQRIPKEGSWLFLDEKLGQESLFVIASKRPLYDADKELCQTLTLPCVVNASDKPPPPPPPPPPPGNLDIKTRGRKHKPGLTLQAETDDGGVAVLRFNFQHTK